MYENLLANVPTDLWIGGKWRKSSDNQRFDVIDPATEKKIASVASASVEDAKAAIDAAEAAFEGWAKRKPRERAEILRKAYEVIMRDAERFAKLITLENGKALSDSRGEVAYAAEFFRWYAEEAVRNIGQISIAPASGARSVAHFRERGQRHRNRRRHDGENAQHGRGLHRSQPLLCARKGARRIRQQAHRQDGWAQEGQRARRRRQPRAAGQQRRPRQGDRAR